ncbi:MAG: GntR family transcriptional regulator [Lachnospiraceae bacterium]
MIIIDYKDTRPIYEQIVEKIRTLILKGVLEPDSQLQSVRSLAMELSINPNTIQKAYTELERQGFIYTIKGRGNFVRYDKSLLEVKKEELRGKVEEVLKEADELGISRKELLEGVEI